MFQILRNSHVIRVGFETEADAREVIRKELSQFASNDVFEVFPIS